MAELLTPIRSHTSDDGIPAFSASIAKSFTSTGVTLRFLGCLIGEAASASGTDLFLFLPLRKNDMSHSFHQTMSGILVRDVSTYLGREIRTKIVGRYNNKKTHIFKDHY
jgi:hypothetical protein